MENNLIYDYCKENKVVIIYSTREDLDMILALFRFKRLNSSHLTSGAVSFYLAMSISSVSYWGPDFIYLSAQEFFTLALPNKSILESIK
jgi:hypothetical protein